MTRLTALALISACWIASTAVHAAEFAAAVGRTSHGACRMGACSFFIIDHAVPVGSTASGTLYAISGREWRAKYKSNGQFEYDEHEYDRPPISVSKQEHFIDMVFCSKIKPIYFSPYESWRGIELLVGEAVHTVDALVYERYWAACHNHMVRNPYGQTAEEALAKKLGYNFSGASGDADNNNNLQPFDVLR